MWETKIVKIGLFGLFRPKSGLFRQKEDQFMSICSKRSANRPRSDKADLLGSTAKAIVCTPWQYILLFATVIKGITKTILNYTDQKSDRTLMFCDGLNVQIMYICLVVESLEK